MSPTSAFAVRTRRMHSARYCSDPRESVDSIVEVFDVDSLPSPSPSLSAVAAADPGTAAAAGAGAPAGLMKSWGGSGVEKFGFGRRLGLGVRLADPVTLRARREARLGDDLARATALTITIFSTVYTTYLIASSNPRSLSWFAYHPPLQMAALTLFTLGILTLQPAMNSKTKAAGLVRHQICMLLAGAPLLAAGTWAIYHSKEVKVREHFTSRHGTVGIIAVGWLTLQMLIGCASVWFGGAALGGSQKAKNVWKYHRLSGYLVYPLLVYAGHLGGAFSTFTGTHSSNVMRIIVYYVGPIITLIAVCSRIRLAKIKPF